MPKSSNFKLTGLKDPRMAARVVIFTLLLLNVGAAIWTQRGVLQRVAQLVRRHEIPQQSAHGGGIRPQ